jgi:hypothetical protein
MKKIIIVVLIIFAGADVMSRSNDNSIQVYTSKFRKVTPLEFKHHRFEYTMNQERMAVRSLNISEISSPDYKNHFDEIHKAKTKSVIVITEPTRLKGPNYKNRRFRE